MKKYLPGFLLFLFLFYLSSIPIFADNIVINEFSSGTTSDWIEVYNKGIESINLSNIRLKDSTTNKKDLSGELNAGDFLVIAFSNWLNNEGDIVKLLKVVGDSEELLEEISYGSAGGLCAPTENDSIGKLPDGSSNIVRFSSYTQNGTNNNSQEDPCPTLTPIPTNTPTPIPTVTNTPSSTKTPTPSKTPTPVPQVDPTDIPTTQPTLFLSPTPIKKLTPRVTLKTSVSKIKTITPSTVQTKIKPTITGQVKGAKTSTFAKDLPKILIIFGILSIIAMIVISFFIPKITKL